MNMVDRREPVALRNKRLFRTVISRSGPMQRCAGMKMTQDALLDAFLLLFDECSKESLKKDVSVTNFVNKYRSLVSEIKSLRTSLDDFKVEAVIGRGHFGEVKVVREKQSNDIYAMKILKKSKTSGSETASLFEEEHDIMCTNTSPWLTSIQYSFQDSDNLYFVMDYHPGGDLLSLLDRHNGTISAEMIKFYIAETALAIRALHQMGYVHRDIKPDNILLDRLGHVKLADFGSAARLTSAGFVNQAMPVGTPEYIAPEVLLSLSNDCSDKRKKCCYGVECDYWSLGVLAYEMAVGRTPFSGAELTVTYFNIMNHKKLKYPENSNVPDCLQDLIDKLLEDPSLRLKHEGLIKHSFFIGIDWNNIRNEVPPFVPNLKSSNDTSNFLEFERNKTLVEVDIKENKKDFSGKDLPFIGFTFSHEGDSKNESSLKNGSNGEQKESSMESVLARVRRENQNLVSKLCEAECKTSEIEKLERILAEKNKLISVAEGDRNSFMREVAKAQTENANLRRALELERQDRKDMEANALNLIRQNKAKLERDMSNLVGQLNSKIEELNDKLTESYTINNELISKYDRAESELKSAKNEIEKLKLTEVSYKEKIAKAREMKRQSVVGFESRIEQLANENHSQANILQQKLNEEILQKNELVEKMKEMEAVWCAKEAQLKEEIQEYENKILQLELKISVQHSEIASLQVKLEEKPNVVLLEQRLEAEKNECSQLRSRIAHMEAEITNTTNSFLDHESAIAAQEETMCALEKEFRQISEEKIELQKKLQKTKEIEEENRQKLSSLEVVVDRLEEGVIKLEKENSQLKQQLVAYSQPITSEAETRYQERITILEDQIAKLENQLQKLRESSILDKENLKSTQNSLWKTEKELSDAKIDIRIAKRECKTAEDNVAKLNEELKKLNEKLNLANTRSSEDIAVERDKSEKLLQEISNLKSFISEREWEIKMLKNQIEEFDELKKSNKQLKKEYNEICQTCKILEKQVVVLKEEKESIKESNQNLEMTKMKLESAMEEMKHKICNLELNNTVLKETGAMMDEQLEDYEKFTVTQGQKIENLVQEKSLLEKEIENIRADLRLCRQSLNEEKSFKLKAEQRVAFLENEIANAEDNAASLNAKLDASNALCEDLKIQVKELGEKISNYEMEIQEWKRIYDNLNAECQWLKQETTTHLTNLYSLRESNYKLTHDLEEEQHMVSALEKRIVELENVITELGAFNKQREVKDEATIQQQNKLISFLQAKLDDAKKKKTLTDVIFGSRTKENIPNNTGWTSPKSTKSNAELTRSKTLKEEIISPNKKKFLAQIVKSPTSQSPFQRQTSLQRMHHNIPHSNFPMASSGIAAVRQWLKLPLGPSAHNPIGETLNMNTRARDRRNELIEKRMKPGESLHKFKNQLVIRSGKCDGCHSNVSRGSQISVCAHCNVQAHPKCSLTIPKTCGLPEGFAKHYAKSVANHIKDTEDKTNDISLPNSLVHEGWIKIPKVDNSGWEKKFARLDKTKLLIYESKPSDSEVPPVKELNLCPKTSHIVVGDVTDSSELPSMAKSDLPYVIKIVLVPESSCWPKETFYMMVLTPAEKPIWLAAVNGIILKDLPLEKVNYQGSKIYTFSEDNRLHLNAVTQINDRLYLLAAEEGLFSLKANSDNKEPTKINGVSKVNQISISQHVGLALMIAGEDQTLFETDYRALISNAEALPCLEPSIVTEPISLGSCVEPCLVFSVSNKIDGTVYLTAGTPTRLILLKWSAKNSQFLVSRVLETLHPCSCILYTKNSVIVGCDKFFRISLYDFVVQELLDPTITSLAFWRIGSFPIQIFAVGGNEFLLCYNEFGVFVNEKGEKTQSDLKWNKVPSQFAVSKPYLFVIHKTSVEVIILPKSDLTKTGLKCNEDSISTASTATIQDSMHINFNNPFYLGSSAKSGSVIISNSLPSNSVDLLLIEGVKVNKAQLDRCVSLTDIDDYTDDDSKQDVGGDEFSFTSSVVQSLCEVGSSTPRPSDESDSCNTYTISDGGKTCSE